MPKYYVRTEAPARQVWEYTVEADSEEHARAMVEDGDVEADNYYQELDMFKEPAFVDSYEIKDGTEL